MLFLCSGGWGYAPKFRKLKSELEALFPDQLEFVSIYSTYYVTFIERLAFYRQVKPLLVLQDS